MILVKPRGNNMAPILIDVNHEYIVIVKLVTIHQFSQCKIQLKIQQTIICVSTFTLTNSRFLIKMKNKGES